MAISQFPPQSGGGTSNDFVVDLNDTTNNVADLGEAKPSGAYSISLSSGDTSFDVYLLDANGNSVGYSNESTIVATAEFSSVSVLGVANSEVLNFTFVGTVSNASSEGDATGAGAYLSSITPTDLPSVDDTATVTGGNFANDVEIYFESGDTSTAAKNVVRSSSTSLIVTRPDTLDPDLDPWSIRAENPGVAAPTGSNAHILVDVVDAGANPVWTTTSPLTTGNLNQSYSETLVATDPDSDSITYSVTSGSLPSGLSLDSATGVISGTPTQVGAPFTVTASDGAGGENSREFEIPLNVAAGGDVSTFGNYTVHTFNATDTFTAFADIADAEYIVLAGGGGGGMGGNSSTSNTAMGGGGGGGGLLSSISGFASGEGTAAQSSITITGGDHIVTVGAGGSRGSGGKGGEGSDSQFGNLITAIGGGGGGARTDNAGDGGCGGGGRADGPPGQGTSGQGFAGGNKANTLDRAAGGGGTASQGGAPTNSRGGLGGKGTHNFLDQRGWGAGGGGYFQNGNVIATGGGSTGNDQTSYAGEGGYRVTPGSRSAAANFGGGGGGNGKPDSIGFPGNGGSGKVVVRYEK